MTPDAAPATQANHQQEHTPAYLAQLLRDLKEAVQQDGAPDMAAASEGGSRPRRLANAALAAAVQELGPLSCEQLSLANWRETAAFCLSVFRTEPLGAVTGLHGRDEEVCMERFVRAMAEEQEGSGRPLSAVLRAGPTIVAAALIDVLADDSPTVGPAGAHPPDASAAEKRLLAAMTWTDEQAAPALRQLGARPHLPELMIAAVAPQLRGPLADGRPGSSPRTLFQRVAQACLSEVAKHFPGIQAHCNDGSAAALARIGWTAAWQTPYTSLPAEMQVKVVPGHMTVMYRDLQSSGGSSGHL